MKLLLQPSPAFTSLIQRPSLSQATALFGRTLHRLLTGVERHPLPPLALFTLAALATAVTAYLRRRRRPGADEVERLRRNELAAHGRIVAGILLDDLDAMVDHAPPTTLFYRYRIGGVEYSCAQDLSALPIPVERLRLDLPVQVRYDARNPGNSIVAAEGWNGLCL